MEHAKVAMGHAHRIDHGGYCFFTDEMLARVKHLSS
jgi:hypothetical protein